MSKMYRVMICYEGAMYFDIEANNEREAQQLAERCFDETDGREIVANLNEIVINEAYLAEEEDLHEE